MPVSTTYPGVYIEEIPSGVRTVVGVPTSITAFIGRAVKGPTDDEDPVTINSYGDFERMFGGLSLISPMSFAVRDFFLNGGSQAVIVRLYAPVDETHPGIALIAADTLNLKAANPGKWGNNLCIRIDYDVSQDIADRYGVTLTDLFNLTVCDKGTGTIEQFRNLTIIASPAQVDLVLANGSELIRVDGDLPSTPPSKSPDATSQTMWDVGNYYTIAPGADVTDGINITSANFIGGTLQTDKKGLYALEKVDLFNMLCIPPYTLGGDLNTTVIAAAATYCEARRAMLLVDPLSTWTNKTQAKTAGAAISTAIGTTSKNAALFFPRISEVNPLRNNQVEDFVPCGAVAGIFARTDSQRGVWKAPAGLDATLTGVLGFSVQLTDAENGELNPLGINCLRIRPAAGPVVWGSRTLQGDDRLASEWKYIPVRRMALFIEETLYRSTQWVVFEPNDEPLWAQIRLNIGAFMHDLFTKGAFQGTTPKEAYFVKCDKETTTQNDINQGKVNIVVGFAPLKPAEFVIIKLQQIAGQIQT